MNSLCKLTTATILFGFLFSIAQSCSCGTMVPQDPFDPLGKWHQRVNFSFC